MTKSRKTESHTPAAVAQHTPPNTRSHTATNSNLWAHQDPTKPHTTLHMNTPTNEGQRMPAATERMRGPHTHCGWPRCPTPMHEPRNCKPKPAHPQSPMKPCV
ncbi:hypothetical protein BS47DRAFT_1368954 [Hydnum rufescens UP504]|uniref:Uncharacterized protein n=1 Tax=Hydnum rufescens UP504 TaxID=1448309 RepID=A0A9P6AE65_9AGAM|nr:hypothetical protein BS47DRAFT_1368954 [Hydnum rufescens UP504]